MLNRIIKIVVKPEYAAEVQTALLENKIETIHEAGNLEMRLFVDKKRANVFFIYERWKDQEALTIHHLLPHNEKVVSLMKYSLESYEAYDLEETKPAPLYEANPKKASPSDDVFAIIFIFKIDPQFREKLLKRFETHVAQSREEEGNLLFDLYTIKGHDDTLCIYEFWRKESDVWDVHFNMPYAVETGKLMHESVIGELEPYMNFVTEFE